MNVKGRYDQVNNYSDRFCIHPFPGIQEVEKTKIQLERTEIPADALHLYHMWQVGLSGGRALMDEQCFVCGKGVALLTCPLCLCTAHVGCAETLSVCNRVCEQGGWAKAVVVLKDILKWTDESAGRAALCTACHGNTKLR